VANAIQVGDRAPLIALSDQNGVERRSDQLQGQPLVVFFYPKDDYPRLAQRKPVPSAITTHALEALGAQVWGVSGDDAGSHGRFAERHQLPYPLLVDRGNALRQAFGVPNALLFLPGRVTYVIDGQGVVRHLFSNLLDGAAHAREALTALQLLAA